MSSFSVSIGREHLWFTAGHFIAFKGFREPLHGHTYRAEVTVRGPVIHDGYVIDFLILKRIAQEECAGLHFCTLLPELSDCLTIESDQIAVTVQCEDGARFVFPRQDVKVLPVAHTSSEEIARYLVGRLRRRLQAATQQTVDMIEVVLEDVPGQLASYRHSVSD